MALVNSSFTVNVTPSAMPPIVHVSEYDIGRTYAVTINGENGSAFNIPSGTTATVEGTLNGVIGFTTDATISGSTVSFTLTESMTAKSGKAWCKIKLTLNDEPIQTCAFILAVDRAGVEADTVIGADGFEGQIQTAVDNYLEEHSVGVEVDPTLSIEGEAADAKVTGDEIGDLKSAFNSVATVEQTTVPGSVNVYNPSNTTAGYYLNSSGVPQAGSGYGYSEKIPCSPGDVVRFYVISNLNTFPGNLYYTDESIGSVKAASDFYSPGTTGGVASFTVPANVTHFSINVRTGYNNEFIITINNAYPESYVPYAPPVTVNVKKINDDVEISSNFLFGKKWAACGDSITFGSAADVDAQGNRMTYAYYVAKRNNMNLTVDAVAGSTLADVTGKSGFSVDRYKNLPADLDYITIFFGLNDSGASVPVGNISDATNTTFYGAWNVVLQYLIEHYPTAKIGVVVNYGGSESYRNATRAICTKYGIVPFDIMGSNLPLFAGRESGVNGAISNARKATFLADGTHPNNAGYIYMSTYFEQYLRSL